MAAEIGAEDAGVANGSRPEESDVIVIGNVGVDETEEDSNFVIPRRTRRKHRKLKLQEESMAAPRICVSFSHHLCEDPDCANLGRGTDHLASSAGSVPKGFGLVDGSCKNSLCMKSATDKSVKDKPVMGNNSFNSMNSSSCMATPVMGLSSGDVPWMKERNGKRIVELTIDSGAAVSVVPKGTFNEPLQITE